MKVTPIARYNEFQNSFNAGVRIEGRNFFWTEPEQSKVEALNRAKWHIKKDNHIGFLVCH